jgi:hypothetical protein
MAGIALSHSFATEYGEEMVGKLPTGNVMRLMRLKEAPEKPWGHQLFQNGIRLKDGGVYTLSFWARASDTLKLTVSTKLSQPPWSFFGLRDDAALTPEWRRFVFNFSAKGAVEGATRLTLGYGEAKAAEVWVADLSIKEKAGTDNVVLNPQFEDGVEPWYIEGKQPGVFEAKVEALGESGPSSPNKK